MIRINKLSAKHTELSVLQHVAAALNLLADFLVCNYDYYGG